jgi:hypothetical protein
VNKAPTNLPASVRQRLLNLAGESKQDFGLLMTTYALERLLYRLSVSKHRDAFFLKGALLFQLWTSEPYRPTREMSAERPFLPASIARKKRRRVPGLLPQRRRSEIEKHVTSVMKMRACRPGSGLQ